MPNWGSVSQITWCRSVRKEQCSGPFQLSVNHPSHNILVYYIWVENTTISLVESCLHQPLQIVYVTSKNPWYLPFVNWIKNTEHDFSLISFLLKTQICPARFLLHCSCPSVQNIIPRKWKEECRRHFWGCIRYIFKLSFRRSFVVSNIAQHDLTNLWLSINYLTSSPQGEKYVDI